MATLSRVQVRCCLKVKMVVLGGWSGAGRGGGGDSELASAYVEWEITFDMSEMEWRGGQ